jgi:hypothetical protein
MSNEDWLKNLEDEKAQKDLGVAAYRIYLGAKEEGATRYEAFWIVVAWWVGMFKGTQPSEDE